MISYEFTDKTGGMLFPVQDVLIIYLRHRMQHDSQDIGTGRIRVLRKLIDERASGKTSRIQIKVYDYSFRLLAYSNPPHQKGKGKPRFEMFSSAKHSTRKSSAYAERRTAYMHYFFTFMSLQWTDFCLG